MRRVFFSKYGGLFASTSGITVPDYCAVIAHRTLSLAPVDPVTAAPRRGSCASPSFPLKDNERGLYNRGVTPEARAAIAEAEAQYKETSDYLHSPPGGLGAPQLRTTADGVTVACIAAPFGEEYVPSHKERYAVRGHVGELSMQRAAEPKWLLDEHAQLNLRKERQLCEMMSSPMTLLQKAVEAERLLHDFYAQRLTVSSRNVEAIVAVWAQCSVEERLTRCTQQPQLKCLVSSSFSNALPGDIGGKGSGSGSSDIIGSSSNYVATMDEVPFLASMKRLYFHARQTHVAPTPLVLECLMTTLSAVAVPAQSVFHLANRLLLDASKYVVLPTRTTYAAFFTICDVNNAMPFALANFKNAVVNLHVAVDAAMVTALLKGLCHNGLVEEALALLARIEHVPLDVQLVNATLEVLLLSEQPQACFSAFEAIRLSPIRPTADTYTLLLLACERSGLWCQTTAILADMQKRRVKGDSKTLNLILKGLLTERLHSYALQLYERMLEKDVEVWPDLRSHMKKKGTMKSKKKKQVQSSVSLTTSFSGK